MEGDIDVLETKPQETAEVKPEYKVRDDSHIIDAMFSLYGEERSRFYASVDGRFFMPKEKGENPQFLTRQKMAYHLYRHWAISTVGSEEGSRWTTFDVDAGGWGMVQKTVAALCQIGIPYERIYVSTSGGKGYHVEIFYDQVIYYTLQQRMYRAVLESVGATTKQIELRPTHTQSIKIPLSCHYKTGNICWYLDRDTGEPIKSKEYIATIQKIPAMEVRELIWALPAEEDEEDAGSEKYTEAEYEPELIEALNSMDIRKLPVIDEAGTRHAVTMRIAMAMRSRGFSHDDALEILLNWYDSQDTESSTTFYDEAVDDIHSIVNWTYSKLEAKAPTYRHKYIITRWDVERVLEQKGLAARGTFFNVLVWSKSKGYARCTERIIAQQIGCSQPVVHRAIKKMEENGQMRIKTGRKHCDQSGYWSERSMMWTRQGVSELAIPEDKLKAPVAEVSIREMVHDFWRVYFETLFAVADRSWIVKQLCKRERELLAEIEQKG